MGNFLVSEWTTEIHNAKLWSAYFPDRPRKAYAKPGEPSPFEQLDPARVKLAPQETGDALMDKIKGEFCSPLPVGLEYSWQIEGDEQKRPEHHNYTYLRCQQMFGTARVEGKDCRFVIDPDGFVVRAELRFLKLANAGPENAPWLSDEETIELAIRFHEQRLGLKLGKPAGKLVVERALRGDQAVMRVQLPMQGVIEVDPVSREARYADGQYPAIAILNTTEERKNAIAISGLGEKLYPNQISELKDNGYLVQGTAQNQGHFPFGIQFLARLDSNGKAIWTRKFEQTRSLQVAIKEDSLLVLQRRSPVPRRNAPDIGGAMVQTFSLSLSSGENLEDPVLWQSQSGELLLAPDGSVFQTWSYRGRVDNRRNTHWISRSNSTGEEAWRAELPGRPRNSDTRREEDSPMIVTSDGAVVVIVYTASDPDSPLEKWMLRFSSRGNLQAEIALASEIPSRVRLLGESGGRIYTESRRYYRDGRQAAHLDLYQSDSLKPVSTAELPYLRTRNTLSDKGNIVFWSESWRRRAMIGELDTRGQVLWRNEYAAERQRVSYFDSVETSRDKLLVLTSIVRNRYSSTSSTASLLEFDRKSAAKRISACKPIDHAALRTLERDLWARYHLQVSTPYSQPVDPVCPSLPDLAYQDFVEQLSRELSNLGVPALAHFVRVTVDRDQQGVAFMPMSPSVHFSMQKKNVPMLFHASPASGAEFAQLLSDVLVPHLYRVQKLQRDLYLHTGLESELSYDAESLIEGSQQAEKDLTTVLELAMRVPYDRYPIQKLSISLQPVVIGRDKLQVPGGYSGKPQPEPKISTMTEQTWLSALQAIEGTNQHLRADACKKERLSRERAPDRMLRLGIDCDQPELIEKANAALADPNNRFHGRYSDNVERAIFGARPGTAHKWVEVGARVDVVDVHGRNPLFNAVRGRSLENINYLASDASTVNQAAFNGETVLHQAVFRPMLPIAVLQNILEASNDVNARNLDGETPLHWSVHTPAYVELLLKQGADIGATDRNGRTPLHRAAAAWGGDDAITLLLAAGADPKAKDSDGRTPLDIARRKNLYHNEQALSGSRK